MMMWLNAEVSGSVAGRSTYLHNDHHVDDQNSDGRDDSECNGVNGENYSNTS